MLISLLCVCVCVCVFRMCACVENTRFHVLTSWKNYYYIIILSATGVIQWQTVKRWNHRPLTLGRLNPTIALRMCVCVLLHGAYSNNKFQFFTHTPHIAFRANFTPWVFRWIHTSFSFPLPRTKDEGRRTALEQLALSNLCALRAFAK